VNGPNLNGLSPAKRALYELRAVRTRLEAHERAATEPIAIVGVGLRFPGGACDARSYWRLLERGVDAVGAIPADRWNIERYYDADPAVPGKMYTSNGGFISDHDSMDASFFGISPLEASSIDPQHRLLLEVAWEALEDSGQDPQKLAGTAAGVFFALSNSDYLRLAFRDSDGMGPYSSTGTNYSVAAGRLSFILGLNGPSMVVDTACSGSLVALHLACRSLRAGECRVAMAGGVNLILSPEVNINFCKARMLASDGRCKSFDERADGYVRSEGCGVVVLKRLCDAQADGDTVLALIRGSAVNQDGRSSGLTVPSGPAQEAVIRAALADARVAPDEIDYVEAHGTGTALGDPIEAHALAAVLGKGRSVPLRVGSVKANVGHLEAAAGVAGLIKVVLALRHGLIPPQLHFKCLNPHINWSGASIEVAASGREWSRGGRPRRAGVSSFGFSGTNAHVVVEEAPEPAPRTGTPRSVHVLPLSARTASALGDLERRYADLAEPDVVDTCYTAGAGRSHFAVRAAYVAGSAEELQRKLRGGNATARGRCERPPEVAFLFTGQGAQYAGMGRELYLSEPAFRQVIDECEAYDLLYGATADARVDDTRFAQPGLFALQCALATLWRSWGVQPAAVLGHSVGEYAAACVAGACTLSDGLRLITARGRLTGGLPSAAGAMAAVLAPVQEVRAAVEPFGKWLSIAAVNGPESVVVSGRLAELEGTCERFVQQGYRVERLRVSHAFHSPLMEEAARALAEEAGAVVFREPEVSLISTVTGRAVGCKELSRAEHWRRQVRETVQFERAMAAVKSCEVFVEIGPGSTLLGLGRELVGGDGCVWAPSIRRKSGEKQQMAESLAGLYARGVAVDWSAYQAGRGVRRVSLPTYPFERQRYWIKTEPEASDCREIWNAISEAGRYQSRQGRLDLDVASYGRRWKALADLSGAYIRSALHRLGAFRVADARVAVDSLLQRCGIREDFAGLIGRWMQRLAEEGTIEMDGDWYFPRERLEQPDVAPLLKLARLVFGADHILLDYVASCGSQLEAILTGRTNALETLFPGGDFQHAEDIYEHAPLSAYFAAIMRAVLASIVHSLRRPLRVLEIGAGTGATTSSLLPLLSGTSSTYFFTDVSEVMLRHGAAKFAAYPFLRYERLDIEKPDPQLLSTFDVIVATNVLHATRDLGIALENVRKLLVPGGHLILCEATTYLPWFDVTTGLIEGWQRFDDGWRSDHPLLGVGEWPRALESAGFDRTLTFPEAGSQAEILGQHVILGQNRDMGWPTAPPTSSVRPAEVPAEQDDAVLVRMQAASVSERRELLVDLVSKEFAVVLGVADSGSLERRRRLFDLGIDSLMAIQVRARLGKALSLERPLPATLVFDHPTIEALSRFLETEILGFHETPNMTKSEVSAFERQIESMSETEAEALLLERIGPSRGAS
jgi:acyl transferase domain-containing protein/SAM-dependent methyltransferase